MRSLPPKKGHRFQPLPDEMLGFKKKRAVVQNRYSVVPMHFYEGATEGGFLVEGVFHYGRGLCKANPFEGMKIAPIGQI